MDREMKNFISITAFVDILPNETSTDTCALNTYCHYLNRFCSGANRPTCIDFYGTHGVHDLPTDADIRASLDDLARRFIRVFLEILDKKAS